jgi:hypothetical protein
MAVGVTALPRRLWERATLREPERAIKALPSEAHGAFARSLALAFRKRDAARALWTGRTRLDARELLDAAATLAADAVVRFASQTSPKPPWLARAEGHAARLQPRAASPDVERDERNEDAAFWALHDEVVAIEREVGVYAALPESFRRLRWRRTLRVAAACLFVLLVVRLVRSRERTVAAASATFHHDVPEFVLDHDVRTNWALPNGQLGWIELRFTRPKAVKSLHVVANNPPYHNRGAKEVHVTGYMGDGSVMEKDFTFPAPPDGSDVVWSDVPLAGEQCDRVRIEVKSFAGLSASFAEIEAR